MGALDSYLTNPNRIAPSIADDNYQLRRILYYVGLIGQSMADSAVPGAGIPITGTITGTTTISGEVEDPLGDAVSQAIISTNASLALTAGQRVILQNSGTNAVKVSRGGTAAANVFTDILYPDTVQDNGQGDKLEFKVKNDMTLTFYSASGTHRVSASVFDE